MLAILLAGGKSSRMPMPKGLMPYRGDIWMHEQIRRMSAAGVREIALVLGFRSDEYLKALPWLKQAMMTPVHTDGLRVSTLINELPEYGPFSSIQAAARENPGRDAFILPIDVPAASRGVWEKLHAANGAARVPIHQGLGGHPVYLSADFLAKIANISHDHQDSRLDIQIRALGDDSNGVEVDDAQVCMNLNTPEDWQALR